MSDAPTAVPRFSVIMAAYNSSNTIAASIESVLQQSFRNFELLVVDDGSTDNTGSVVLAVDDPRLKYLPIAHAGVSAARNAGIAEARGEIITFLDSDDRAYPEWLAVFDSLLAHALIGIAFCGAHSRRRGETVTTILPRNSGQLHGGGVSRFLSGTYAVRRALLQLVGGFDSRFAYSENTEIGIRLTSLCEQKAIGTAAVDLPLLSIEYPPDSRRFNVARMEQQLQTGRMMVEEHRGVLRKDPKTAADYLAVAGVCAARLGRTREARELFARALCRYPQDPRHIGRLLMALSRRLAARVWGKAGDDSRG